MRAVTGRYQKQKHIFRHSFKLSAIYHIIALQVNLAWTLNLDLLKRSDFPLNVDYMLSGRGIIDANLNMYRIDKVECPLILFCCGREGVAIFFVLIESLGKRTRVRR